MKNILKEAITNVKSYSDDDHEWIELGSLNGQSVNSNELLNELRKFQISEPEEEQILGNCYSAFKFIVEIEDILYYVSYTVDSSK